MQEMQAHEDHRHARDPRQPNLIVEEDAPEGRGGKAHDQEHRRQPQDEHQRGRHRAALARLQPVDADTGHIGQIGRHDGQHAGRQKRHHAGQQRDKGSGHEGRIYQVNSEHGGTLAPIRGARPEDSRSQSRLEGVRAVET